LIHGPILWPHLPSSHKTDCPTTRLTPGAKALGLPQHHNSGQPSGWPYVNSRPVPTNWTSRPNPSTRLDPTTLGSRPPWQNQTLDTVHYKASTRGPDLWTALSTSSDPTDPGFRPTRYQAIPSLHPCLSG
jgi:hypothetical protein